MEVVASGVRVFNQKMAQNPKFCQDWEINLDYDAKSLSRVDLTVSSRSSLCGIDVRFLRKSSDNFLSIEC